MKAAFVILLSLALLFGCPALPFKAPEANKTFTCPDGTNVTNSSLCKKIEPQKFACQDGTMVADPKLCKQVQQPISEEQQKRAEQIAKVKNASAAIDLDRQLLLRGRFIYDVESLEGCRNYFGYYQGRAREFQADYGSYLDEFGELAEMYAENETCKNSVSGARQAVISAWQYGWNNAAVMMTLCPQDDFHRKWYFGLQTNTTWENVTAFVGFTMDGLDEKLSRDCPRAYKAEKETID